MRLGTYTNRKNLVEKKFIVKVAYPKWLETATEKINKQFIYNKITGNTNTVECDVEEVTND